MPSLTDSAKVCKVSKKCSSVEFGFADTILIDGQVRAKCVELNKRQISNFFFKRERFITALVESFGSQLNAMTTFHPSHSDSIHRIEIIN